MALPKQVEQQIREVEELERQLAEGNPPVPDPGETPTTAEPPTTQPAEPTPAPVEVAKQDKSPAPAPTPEPEEKWEQRYKTLKGMYDAEVPRLHVQVKELSKQVETLTKKLETPPAPPAPTKVESLVTDEDVKTFGADLIEVQRKVAREVAMEFQTTIEALKAENQTLREQLTDTNQQVSSSTFEQRLHRLVPDFDAVNADQRWIDWLNEVDPLIRAPRKSLAQAAFNDGDADAVAHFVALFKQSVAAPAAPTADPIKEELNAQVQPPKSSTTNAPTSKVGKTYSSADIDGLFKRITDLNKRGKFDEAQKLEAEIDAAYTEGRVTA